MPTRQEIFKEQQAKNYRPPIANEDKRREAYGCMCCFDKPNIGDLARHAVVNIRAALGQDPPWHPVPNPGKLSPHVCTNARKSTLPPTAPNASVTRGPRARIKT